MLSIWVGVARLGLLRYLCNKFEFATHTSVVLRSQCGPAPALSCFATNASMAICFVLREHANVAIPLVIVTSERLVDGVSHACRLQSLFEAMAPDRGHFGPG